MIIKLTTVFIVLFISFNAQLYSQVTPTSDLYQAIKAKDHSLFEVGFNQCNLDEIEKLVVDDIEFYHDKDGITRSKKKFLSSIKKNLCTSGINRIKRVLDEASFEVFPLYENGKLYGAIQNGVHSFGETQATYSHVWLLEKGAWKLSRVLSYNHHSKGLTQMVDRIEVAIDDLKLYVGEYEFSPEFILTVRIKDGELYGGSQGQEVKISSYAEHKFIDDEQTHDLEFLVDKNGNVTSLHMKGSGMEMTALKK